MSWDWWAETRALVVGIYDEHAAPSSAFWTELFLISLRGRLRVEIEDAERYKDLTEIINGLHDGVCEIRDREYGGGAS